MKRSLVISLILHVALLSVALLIFQRADQPSFVQEMKPFSIEIEKGPAKGSLAKSPGSGGRRSRPKLPSLKDLGVFSQKFGSSRGTPSTGNNGNAQEQGPESPYGFENQLTTRTSPILVHLFHRIDGGIAYPSELRQAHISGEVTAKLGFDEQGHWIDSVSDIKGNSFLRVYVIHQLRRIFAEGIPENLWKAEPQALSIEASFVFDIRAPESVTGAQVGPLIAPSVDPTKFSTTDTDGGQRVESRLISEQQGFYGRKFHFYRVHLSSPLDWKLGPFAGYGIMPTVGIDPGWFAEKIGNLIHPKAKIDPLDRYRDDPDW